MTCCSRASTGLRVSASRQLQLAGAEALGEGDGEQERLVEAADAQQQPLRAAFEVGHEVEEVGGAGVLAGYAGLSVGAGPGRIVPGPTCAP
ncbi:hypothetical protein BEK98_41435 [Streptomyces diastatochromogenes]|uniref:Uncharacterized protein n=1 Tax=Streptomyces diastatochromogenes TaxID=42236 RepID=A0A233RZ83_STRDA|nr:hypothetical protein BEK98_41435 [Streptomyces diastatochromogenes]